MKRALRAVVRSSALLGAQSVRRCHVVKSPYRPVAVPPVSVTDFVWAGLGAVGDRPAIVAADTGKQVSYAELRSKCRGLATWLERQLPPHSVVAVLLPNSAEFAVAALGGLEAGLVVSALHPDFTEQELTRLFKLTDTGCVVTASKKIFTVLEAKARLERECGREFPMKIVSVDREVRFSGVHYLEDVTREERELPCGRAEDPALLVADEEGAAGMSHGSLVASCRQVSRVTQAEAKVAALPPMHHHYGLTQVLLQSLSRGATLVTMGDLRPRQLVKALKQHGVTSLPAVAGLARYLVSGGATRGDLAGLHSVTLAAPLPPPDLARLLDLLPPDAELAQLYGPARGSFVFHQPRGELRPGSVGRPLPSTEAKVVDSRGEVAARARGEICVRGPQLSTDAWVRTGDLGYYDSDGYFYVTGRIRDAIETPSGLRVSASELEELLAGHPDVKEVVVLPTAGASPDGPSTVAVVVPREPQHVPPSKELLDFVAARVAPYKRLSNVVFARNLPKTPSGAVDRPLLAKLYGDQHEAEIVALTYV